MENFVYAGLDVGTSGCKLVAYDLEGHEVYSSSTRYSETGSHGIRELDPEIVIESVKETLRNAGKNCPRPIKALSVASIGETVIFLDKSDKPLMNSILTGDCRGIPQTKRLREEKGAQNIFEITGLPPNELYGLPKWIWINEETDVITRAEKIFFFEDYVGYILTGKRKVSYSSSARSLAFDIEKKSWSQELLSIAGLKADQFSKPSPPFSLVGKILPDIAKELSLPEDLKIMTGGHDQTCAAFGSGLSGMNTGECGMGTCEFMFVMLPGAEKSIYMLENDFTCIPYVLENSYLSSLEITTCGILKNWARDNLFTGFRDNCERNFKNFFKEMDMRASEIETEVLLLPQFGSSGNPDLSMDARGTITGLTIHTQREEIYRAILEGMAFQNYLAYEKLNKLGTKMETITATGGGAASDLTLQIRADVFNMTVKTLENDEAGTLGCMMMSAISDGAYKSVEEAFNLAVRTKKEFKPDIKRHEAYMKKFQKYKQLYDLMHDFM